MARKISHTKRGTYYNGPTGRHKMSSPLGILFSAAGAMSKASRSSKNRKNSASYRFSLNSNYSGHSKESNSTTGCVVLCLLLFVIFSSNIFSICSRSHSGRKKHNRWQHPERYRPQNNIFAENIADPWHCF